MRVLSVVHQRDAAAGVFAEPAAEAGHELVEWVPAEAPPPALGEFDAAIVFGGEAQVDEEDATPGCAPTRSSWPSCSSAARRCWASASARSWWPAPAGAVVRRAAAPEIGWTEIELTPEGVADPLLGFLPERFTGFGWHYYEWLLPPGAMRLARSAACLQAFRLEQPDRSGASSSTPRSGSTISAPGSTPGRRPRRAGHRARPRGDPRRERQRIGAWNERGPRDLAALPRCGGGAQSSGVRYAPLSPPSTMKVDAFT